MSCCRTACLRVPLPKAVGFDDERPQLQTLEHIVPKARKKAKVVLHGAWWLVQRAAGAGPLDPVADVR
jgi:hypothetical protein